MSPDVGFSRLESSHYKLVQRIKINSIQRINGKYDGNDSINKDPQQRIRNYKKQPNENCRVEKCNNQNAKFVRGVNSKFESSEETISGFEDRSIAVIQSGEKRGKH